MAALVGPFLPIVAGGGLAYALAQYGNTGAPPVREFDDEERRRRQQMVDLERNGASASFWQTQHNKTFLMGSNMKESLTADFSGGGYQPNPDVDPLEHVWRQHADLAEFDRQDTFVSLVFGDGEIRMSKRMPIVASLTPEIYHPNDPEMQSNFGAYRAVPNWANHAQLTQAAEMLDPNQSKDRFLRDYHDQEFFTRAAGQSFRYEE